MKRKIEKNTQKKAVKIIVLIQFITVPVLNAEAVFLMKKDVPYATVVALPSVADLENENQTRTDNYRRQSSDRTR